MTLRTLRLTTFALLAFAGNSLLCRVALKHSAIDPASFTTLRLLFGALTLALIVHLRSGKTDAGQAGTWPSALALFAYAAGFSYAYVELSTATGALLLFGAVQATMLGWGLLRGERPSGLQRLGLVLAVAGLVALLLPGLSAPPLASAALMLGAGFAWGVYSLRGRNGGDPTRITAGNFLRACLPALLLALIAQPPLQPDYTGAVYALASGALTSGVGYAIWYAALPALSATQAASVQLLVPVIAALGGTLLLGEALSLRLLLAGSAILGGIALVIIERRRVQPPR